MPRISLEEHGRVVALSEEGYSQRAIATRVGCSQKSVFDKKTGSVRSLKSIGRPRVT